MTQSGRTPSNQLLDEVSELVDGRPVDLRRLGGGDAAATFEMSLDDGTTLFAKTAGDEMPGALAAEAASLAWLADTGSVPVPTVHGADDRWLVTQHIESASPNAAAAEALGRGLARMHAAGAPAHGAPPPGGPTDAWIGLAPMRNQPAAEWPSFYAAHRIEPYLHRALDQGVLTQPEGQVITRVCEQLDDLAGPTEPASRLHGDLWSGNVHWGRADHAEQVRAWLIDPAGHGGHRETDLAMLQLFGCPYLDQVLGAYQEVSPLADGWRDRVSLHQLFPLLVHAVLFGRSYAVQAVTAAKAALRTG